MRFEAHRCLLPKQLCRGWFSYDRSENGDHIIDIKRWRIRINFGPA